jgi:hypothetical protein
MGVQSPDALSVSRRAGADFGLWQGFGAHVPDQHEHDQRDGGEQRQRRSVESE